jgi:chromosome segregation ATPase
MHLKPIRLISILLLTGLILPLAAINVFAEQRAYSHVWAIDPTVTIALDPLSDSEARVKGLDVLGKPEFRLTEEANGLEVLSLRTQAAGNCGSALGPVFGPEGGSWGGSVSMGSFFRKMRERSSSKEQQIDRVTLILSGLGECERSFCRLTSRFLKQNPGVVIDVLSIAGEGSQASGDDLLCYAEQSDGLFLSVSDQRSFELAVANVQRIASRAQEKLVLVEKQKDLNARLADLEEENLLEKSRFNDSASLLSGMQSRLDEALEQIGGKSARIQAIEAELIDDEHKLRYARQLRSISEAGYEKLQAKHEKVRVALKEVQLNSDQTENQLRNELITTQKKLSRFSSGKTSVETLTSQKGVLEKNLLAARADAVTQAEKRIETEQKLESVLITLEEKNKKASEQEAKFDRLSRSNSRALRRLDEVNIDISTLVGDKDIGEYKGLQKEISDLRSRAEELVIEKTGLQQQIQNLTQLFEGGKEDNLKLKQRIYEMRTTDLGLERELTLARKVSIESNQKFLDARRKMILAEDGVRQALGQISNLQGEVKNRDQLLGEEIKKQKEFEQKTLEFEEAVSVRERRIDKLKTDLWNWQEKSESAIQAVAADKIRLAQRAAEQADLLRQDAVREKASALKVTGEARKKQRSLLQELELAQLKLKSVEEQLARREEAWESTNSTLVDIKQQLLALRSEKQDNQTDRNSLEVAVGDYGFQVEALTNEKNQLLSEVRAREEMLMELQDHFADFQDKHGDVQLQLSLSKAKLKEAEARLVDLFPIN